MHLYLSYKFLLELTKASKKGLVNFIIDGEFINELKNRARHIGLACVEDFIF